MPDMKFFAKRTVNKCADNGQSQVRSVVAHIVGKCPHHLANINKKHARQSTQKGEDYAQRVGANRLQMTRYQAQYTAA